MFWNAISGAGFNICANGSSLVRALGEEETSATDEKCVNLDEYANVCVCVDSQ